MAADHWFEAVADHLGSAYLRYSFTKGTDQEVGFLVEHLGLGPGDRVLDVGCGPGRHARAMARLGIEVIGVDISRRFVDLARVDAPPGARFLRGDARNLGRLVRPAAFDAVISLCQGAFGLPADPLALDPDLSILTGMARAVRPGGAVVVSAFSSYFVVGHPMETSTFAAAQGVNHERTVIKDEQGVDADADLWTACYTPRELRLLARLVGLDPESVFSVTPGRYQAAEPNLTSEEFLLVARRKRR